ncbi:hypothetical protein [Stackebrandtia soli]|uniref:hypothetical protein n=1 Tax=Stackebrandtia soli TaxID=1892856 RepID=UPI0039E80BC9
MTEDRTRPADTETRRAVDAAVVTRRPKRVIAATILLCGMAGIAMVYAVLPILLTLTGSMMMNPATVGVLVVSAIVLAAVALLTILRREVGRLGAIAAMALIAAATVWALVMYATATTDDHFRVLSRPAMVTICAVVTAMPVTGIVLLWNKTAAAWFHSRPR